MARWDGILEFLAVVEAGGFTHAAQRLGVSASHVSRQVARLEDAIGVKLLARSTRVVRMTEAGAQYHARIAPLAAEIEEANQTAAGDQAELAGLIRVSAAGPFGELSVAPRLAEFAQAHPQIRIDIDFNTHVVDLIEQGFDFAIRYGVLAGKDLIARKLARRDLSCAASPDYLARHGTPRRPADLRKHVCLIGSSDRWVFKHKRTRAAIDVRVSGRWRTNNGHALRCAAVAGLGVVYTPTVNLRPALDDGRLVRILAGYEDQARASWIVFPDRRHMPTRVRAAIDHLVDAFAE